MRRTLSEKLLGATCLLLMAGTSGLWSATADAQQEDAAPARRIRFATTAGPNVWSDLSALRPDVPGEFDTAGLAVNFSVHWRMQSRDTSDLLLGFDVGIFSHDSDVFHARDEISARGLYLTPSVKWQFGSSDGPSYSLDVGIGYYLVDIAEVVTSRYYGYYCCYAYYEEQLWEDSSFGGFIGATVDFGDAGRRRGGGFTMGAKIHWLDLGTVRDEGRFRPFSTLGPNAGRLEGPIYSLQFGYAF